VSDQQPLRTPVPSGTARVHREVVSFVRRSDRMNPSQQKAWARHADDWLVPVSPLETETSVAPDQPLDLPALFGRAAPLAVEIGTGTGESTEALARAHPEWNILAFEVFQPAVASAMNLLGREGHTNVRFAMNDAAAGLRHLLDEGAVTELWTFFPDPWHKTRHHKRRLVRAEFAALVASRLAPSGVWRLATDWDDYAHWLHTTLDSEPGLRNPHLPAGAAHCPAVSEDGSCDYAGWAPRLALRPITKFEAKGLAAGRSVHDLTYTRRSTEPEPGGRS
jgi:tRNA (guanine-N7-)-methyltransferase